MQAFLQPSLSISISLLNSSPSATGPPINSNNSYSLPQSQTIHTKLPQTSAFGSPKTVPFGSNSPPLRCTHLSFCSQDDALGDILSTQLPEKVDDGEGSENEGLGLLDKPSPLGLSNALVREEGNESEIPGKGEALEPFLKFFKSRESLIDEKREESELGVLELKGDVGVEDKEGEKVNVDYYEPKPGDSVVGVVVSGNENKLDVTVGANLLGTMLTKEVMPLYDREMDFLLCDLKKDADEFMVKGKTGIVKDEVALSGGPGPGKPVVETGTVLFAEVLGRTLSGRPLLSTRRLFRRVAWHRVRQIKELNEPIQVQITEWNTGGLLTRIEGLRAFLPKAELMSRVNNFKQLKENVGCRMYVLITRINEANNDLILSEKEAWEALNLREGTLLEGTVMKIFLYGAQIQIGDTDRRGLLHISNISRARVKSVSDVLKVDEKVKVLVVKSMFPDKISLSTADLESEAGLFVTNRERVFSEAKEMAKKYRQNLPPVATTRKSETPPSNTLSFTNEETMYANWRWFKFERDNDTTL